MEEEVSGRCILLCSRLASDYHITEMGKKSLQHVLTDWLPRAIYADLPAEATSVVAEVTKDFSGNKAIFNVAFKNDSGANLKTATYFEGRVVGCACHYYDPKQTTYNGKKDGYDCRLVYYKDKLLGGP